VQKITRWNREGRKRSPGPPTLVLKRKRLVKTGRKMPVGMGRGLGKGGKQQQNDR